MSLLVSFLLVSCLLAARGFAIPSSCGGLGAWPAAATTTAQVARFARHFLSAEQPIMKALKYPSN